MSVPAPDPPPERTSLYLPLLPMLLSGVVSVAGAVFVMIHYYGGGWRLWLLAIFVGSAVLYLPRRIDLDAQGITCIPLIPLWRKQSFRWSDIGTPFERNTGWTYRRVYRRSGNTILQAPILYGKPYRVMGVFPSRKLTLSPLVATSLRGSPLGEEALLFLLDSYES